MTSKVCNSCGVEKPLSCFLVVTLKAKKPTHAGWRGPYSYCRDCTKEQKREWRRRKAEAAGRSLRAKGEWQAEQKAACKGGGKEQRRKSRRIAWALCLAFWALVRMSPEERKQRSIDRQRERYNSDAGYQAKRKATKIRRKRAIKGTQIEPVNRELVAQRDGWCCGICGQPVTRATWSLDHVIPLSKGGAHTYENVQLAHRTCNSTKGDRLPAAHRAEVVG